MKQFFLKISTVSKDLATLNTLLLLLLLSAVVELRIEVRKLKDLQLAHYLISRLLNLHSGAESGFWSSPELLGNVFDQGVLMYLSPYLSDKSGLSAE